MKWLPIVIFIVLLAVVPRFLAIEVPADFVFQDIPRLLPEIDFMDGSGKASKLGDFRGKIVLLNIWATWCPPCRKEMPALDRLQGQLGGPDFEVVALSVDRGGTDNVHAFYAQLGIRRLSLNIDASAQAQFALGVGALPTTLLIDRQGQEIGRLVGPANWDSPEMIGLLKRAMARNVGNRQSADMDHPFHVHGTQFQVVETEREGKIAKPPYRAWKDTVNVASGETVRILLRQERPGLRMYHCHILEHEQLGMMAVVDVRAA